MDSYWYFRRRKLMVDWFDFRHASATKPTTLQQRRMPSFLSDWSPTTRDHTASRSGILGSNGALSVGDGVGGEQQSQQPNNFGAEDAPRSPQGDVTIPLGVVSWATIGPKAKTNSMPYCFIWYELCSIGLKVVLTRVRSDFQKVSK